MTTGKSRFTGARGTSVIIVGGGILGAATLYELARRGVAATLFEQRTYGRESTGKSAAIVRMHYSNPEVVAMALRSRDSFRCIHELADCEPVYQETGWLFLVDDEDAEHARHNRRMQLAQGSRSVEVNHAALRDLVPGISTDGISYAIFEKESGYADPIAATQAYLTAARRAGAYAFENAQVERLLVAQDDRVHGVVVDGQKIECDCVVLAAGAWSTRLAGAIGIKLPMKVTREQDIVYHTGESNPIPFPVSDQADRIYLRPLREAGPKLQLVGRGFPKPYEYVNPDDYNGSVDADFERDVRTRLVNRLQDFASVRPVDSRVGLYSVPPDWHPLLGPLDGIAGLQLATGGSGHCFKLGPAIGELVAAAIVGEPLEWASVDRFSVSRFERGETFASTFGGNRA